MEEESHNPEQERLVKLRARREREFQAQIKAHGGTGLPPDDLTPTEACRQGICPKCSGHWNALHTHAWKHYPGLSMAEGLRAFREEFPEIDYINSGELRKILSDAKNKQMQGPEGEQIRAQIAETLSRPRPDLYTITGLNPSGWNPSNWEIAKRITDGMEQLEIAKELGGDDNHKLVGRRAGGMGLTTGTSSVYDQGEPFANGNLFRLREISGLPTADFDLYVRLSQGRSQATRPADSLVNPEDARKVIAWRDGAIRSLVAAPELYASRKYGWDSVLKTFIPQLPEVSCFLVLTMQEIRQAAREHSEWGVTELGEFVCYQAQIEQNARVQDCRWRKTLRYLCRAEDFLEESLDRLRGPELDGLLVHVMMGFRYGATEQTVEDAIRERTDLIDPRDMFQLLHRHALKSVTPPPKKRGPEALPNSEKEKYRISAKVNAHIPEMRKVIEAFNKIPAKIRGDASMTRNRLTKGGFSDSYIKALYPETTDPQVAARRFVSNDENLPFETVGKYHRAHPTAGLE